VNQAIFLVPPNQTSPPASIREKVRLASFVQTKTTTTSKNEIRRSAFIILSSFKRKDRQLYYINMESPPQPEEQPVSAEEAAMTQTLAHDRPTMDAAIKAFMSLVCARTLTASATDAQSMVLGIVKTANSNADKNADDTSKDKDNDNGTTNSQHPYVLQVARAILKSINAYEFPIHATVAAALRDKPGLSPEKQQELLELSIVARLWNGLVQSKQKPSRFLGRTALLLAWKDLDVMAKLLLDSPKDDADADSTIIYDRQVEWVQEFERLLFHQHDPKLEVDNDAALIWDADGGQAELAKRRQRRQAGATERGPVTPS
jgi:hypothetical protein